LENEISEILLTVEIGGRLGDPISHVSKPEIVERVKTSPFERFTDNGKTLIM
jgi:hypothetical protein